MKNRFQGDYFKGQVFRIGPTARNMNFCILW